MEETDQIYSNDFISKALSCENSSFHNISKIPNFETAEGIDHNCIHTIKNRLVRIQYPGVVDNLDKALETLGGMARIEKAVSISPSKLHINLHPRNKFNKGSVAECEFNSGVLLKIRKEKESDEQIFKYSYEIVGVTVRNFIFNKLVDFQFLPIVAEFPETSNSEVNYVHDLILPSKLFTLESILQGDKADMQLFLPPVSFSRSDTQRRLNPIEKQSSDDVELKFIVSKKNTKKKCTAFVKPEKPSIFHKFAEPEIPERPTEFISQLITKRNYENHVIKLQIFFEERPIWTRNGIKYNTNLSNDLLKVLLPAVAYYELTGPWRCTWIRFGYDPRRDPEARKFQNLDYRIPNPIRSHVKVKWRDSQSGKSEPTSLNRLSIGESRKGKSVSLEDSYILRPNMLPPTRQVFYQYCDILLPEIQTMLARLPPVPLHTKCDPKNGWFPTSFVEQCREIVNKYIDQQATNELQKGQGSPDIFLSKTKKEPKSTDYCSLIIRNVKRGLLKESNPNIKMEDGPSTSYESFETSSVTEIDDTDCEASLCDEGLYQEHDLDDLVDELENTDGDLLISTDQEGVDIDVDALEDVKNIIANSHSNET